ncbi:MAG: DUF2314 domain-containing protein [Acidobacteria bacterium]|nr:DUF2314 domain-containing protein [Acidobacteriota bacterium]MCB9397921.1 DUF2314 domain-containing protein [Acidobacteriota bacterium]
MSSPIFFFDATNPEMHDAIQAAQSTFKYFWRELSWERRRIIPALDYAMIKLPFSETLDGEDEPTVEQMWVTDVDFDGETLHGQLINSPHYLESYQAGDWVSAPFSDLSDWLINQRDKAYGGFTVQIIRMEMSNEERKEHDLAWGLTFPEPGQIWLEPSGSKGQGGLLSKWFKKAEKAPQTRGLSGFLDHPMCTNVLPTVEKDLMHNSGLATQVDDKGWTRLHEEALAGNWGIVRLLVQFGAVIEARTPQGKTPADLALDIGWSEIANYLRNEAAGEPRR